MCISLTMLHFMNSKCGIKLLHFLFILHLQKVLESPPIEAAMAGVPVVCNNATAMGDFTFFGDNLVDITDQENLDSAIINALNSPFNPEVRDLISSRYNWQNSAQTLLTALISYQSV